MRVARIIPIGRRDVYNMEVSETHDFVIQGGVISHNCADESRYFMMSRPVKPLVKEMKTPRGDDPLNQREPEKPVVNVYKYTI